MSFFKILVKDLPSGIIINTQRYLLSAIYHRLDLSDNEIRKAIQFISSQLCRRLPTQCILDFLILQFGCFNPNIRRNSLDVLTVIILTTEITQFGIRLILEKLVPTLFDPNQTVVERHFHLLRLFRS